MAQYNPNAIRVILMFLMYLDRLIYHLAGHSTEEEWGRLTGNGTGVGMINSIKGYIF